MDYWEEAVAIALEEAGVKATESQLKDIAVAIKGSHENYGMYVGYDVASSNRYDEQNSEIRRLKDELNSERGKVTCTECSGSGFITMPGPYHSSTSDCYKCRGAGRV